MPIWFPHQRSLIVTGMTLLLLLISIGVSVAQQPVAEALGRPASIEPVSFLTKLKWAIDLLVPIARHDVAIHHFSDAFPSQMDEGFEHVRWFAVWNSEGSYSAVPISIQSAGGMDIGDWLRDRQYVTDAWNGTAWVGTSMPIADLDTSSPVFRADLRSFR